MFIETAQPKTMNTLKINDLTVNTFHPGLLTADVKRIVVVIPDQEFDVASLGRDLWELAAKRYLNVELVGVTNDSYGSSGLSKRLVKMEMILRDKRIHITRRVLSGATWSSDLQGMLSEDAILLCVEGTLHTGRLGRIEKAEVVLAQKTRQPVYLMPGYSRVKIEKKTSWLLPVVFWFGAILLLGLFAWLEHAVFMDTPNWEGNIIDVVFLVIEIILLLVWSAFFIGRVTKK